MYPTALTKIPSSLREKAEAVILEKDAPSVGISLGFQEALIEYMRLVNSYYTNAMEGNPTRIHDIEAAIKGTMSERAETRNWQLEHLAHIAVEKELAAALTRDPHIDPTTPAFLCDLHKKFYTQLPEEMHFTQTHAGEKVAIVPGALRDRPVSVGRHIPPESHEKVVHWMNEFHRCFQTASRVPTVEGLIAVAIAHHRFLWIHPFLDGNGRVVRLFTNAYLWRIGLRSAGRLWTINRGLGRGRREYDGALAQADLPPRHSFDGRGSLSEEETVAFCSFFLDVMLDQIRFMVGIVEPTQLWQRFDYWLALKLKEKALSKGAGKLLKALFTHPSLTVTDVESILGIKERGARKVISEVLTAGYARRAHNKAPMSFALTHDMAEVILPRLA